MKALRAVLVALALAGCANPAQLPLDVRWAPLVRVAEDPLGITQSKTIQTRGDTCYVQSLPWFVAQLPPGTERDVHLTHERVHAQRQAAAPSEFLWFAEYCLSRSFRWEEERRAYAAEFVARWKLGTGIDLGYYADFLSGDVYSVLGTPMLTRDEAAAWAAVTWEACQRGETPTR